MNIYEKLFSLFALAFLAASGTAVVLIPATRTISVLMPLALVGILVNAGLLFVVFKDIFTRTFENPGSKLVWGILVFVFFPAILIYLPLHGFKEKNSPPEKHPVHQNR